MIADFSILLLKGVTINIGALTILSITQLNLFTDQCNGIRSLRQSTTQFG